MLKLGETIFITYQKRHLPIEVIYQWNKDIIGINRQTGEFFATYWEPYKNRTKQQFSITKRHWKKYPDLFSLIRATNQAIVKTGVVTVDRLITLRQIAQDYHLQLITAEIFDSPEPQTPRSFFALVEELKKTKSKELQAAKNKALLCFTFKDSLGRTNIGALCARLTAVDALLEKRIFNIFGWLPHYQARLEVLRQWQLKILFCLDDLEKSFMAMQRHTIIKRGVVVGKQKENLIASLEAKKIIFDYWQSVQPFNNFAKICLVYLGQTITCIDDNDFIQAQQIIEKVIKIIHRQKIQIKIADLLQSYELDLIKHDVDYQFYQEKIWALTKDAKPISSEICGILEQLTSLEAVSQNAKVMLKAAYLI